MTDDLRVVAITEQPATAWENWRLIWPYWRLSQLGYDVRCQPLDAHGGIGIRRGEVVVLPRMTVGPDGRQAAENWLRALRQQASALIYEADDDIFSLGFSEHLIASNFRQGLSDRQLEHQRRDNVWYVQQCDGVTVSSEPLAEIVRGFTDKPVIVVPNALDVRWFRAMLPPRAPWAEDGIVTVGWSGGRRPERDLEPMAEAWGRIARRYAHVRFVVAAPGRPSFLLRAIDDDSRVTLLPWLDWQDYPRAFQVDIGCCSVADTPFSRAKTPIKAWEYAIAGAAVVATPTLYDECVTWPDQLATTADEWEASLSELIEDERQRSTLAGMVREHVEQHHALDVQAEQWPAAYRAILARQPSLVH